ncbi:uncharacterized protein LOC116338472 [Contarinia nasturtii]|uniref:uncharacterized protein LOC116338472 n=1 Tax=Contarinia nasturtii TaxID=265458 RepID=UPI0012D4C379|nr:uncharacterized protein LOC116338472 [Contarinia nasturtii]
MEDFNDNNDSISESPDSSESGNDAVNVDDIELIGDPDRETDDIELVFVEYELEPGQLIFINSSSSLSDDVDADSSVPALFIGEDSDDNAFLQILNLETLEQETVDAGRMIMPFNVMSFILLSELYMDNDGENEIQNENGNRDGNDENQNENDQNNV